MPVPHSLQINRFSPKIGHPAVGMETFGQMFEVMLRQAPEEQWDMVYPVDDEWPSADQMASYQVGTHQPLQGTYLVIQPLTA